MNEFEQQRRDLKSSNPDLYRYISQIEQAKILDSTGDALNNKGYYDAANFVWARSADVTQ